MAKNNTLKFLEGAAAGIALGVAANMFLSSKKGKEVQKDVVGVIADFYKYISPKVRKMEKVGEKEYKLFMKNSAEQYVAAKKISGDIAKELIKEVQQSWEHFSSYLE